MDAVTSLPSPPRDNDSDGDRDRSLLQMVEEASERLAHMEISCRDTLDARSPRGDELSLLRLQLEQLKKRFVDHVHLREDRDAIFQKAMSYAAAKGTANAVLHTLFDQASAGKCQVLEQWVETGVIPTRDGLKHWRLDLREIRNESGATVLHVAVDASIARQNLKVKLVELLVDRVGFDVNVRDAFGRTPLHVASMAGHVEVTHALLARGADASRRDRAGLTPLSVVRTLSRPPEEIVQLLANAESAIAKQYTAASDSVDPKTAVASVLFLRVLSRFARPDIASALSKQTRTLLNVLLQATREPLVAFDEALRSHVPVLFETPKPQYRAGESSSGRLSPLARLSSLFLDSMYWDARFVDELKLEAAAYGHSLVTSTCATAAALAGPTWEGLVLKLIQGFKLEMASPSQLTRTASDRDFAMADAANVDAASETDASSTSEQMGDSSSNQSARSPLYATTTSSIHSRQAWYYAVLVKASTQPFPGTLSVTEGESAVVCSEDVGRFFPLDDRLLIVSSEYHCVAYDPSTQTIQLDREFEGVTATEVKAYLAGSCSSHFPPYVTTKRIWEREPGNKYEDHTSNEQELFQDYQFLDPDSEYEIAVKLGPVPTVTEARAIADAWRLQTRKLFDERKCQSGLQSCEYYCPQRSGHSLCAATMAAVGRGLAKERLGRATFSKQLKPRASLQKYQDLFLGKAPWPGSPSVALELPSADSKVSFPVDLT